MMKKNVWFFLTRFFLLFILAAFIGWAYEIGCVYVIFGFYFDRGVLHLPACPIYGFGMLTLYPIFRKVKNPLIIFAGSTLISTIVELVASLILEYRFNLELWSYIEWPLNYQGRVSAISSCIFGLMALLFMKIAVPAVRKLYSEKTAKYTAAATTALFIFCLIWEMRFI